MARQELRGSESRDQHKRSLTVRAKPCFTGRRRGFGTCAFGNRLCRGKNSGTQLESVLPFAIGQKTEMANLHETAREHMQQEAAHKLQSVQCHEFLLIVVGRIAPAKSNLAIFETNEPAIGDRHAVSVVSQILDHVPWPRKRLFDVDEPIFVFESPGKSIEGFAHLKRRQAAVELKLAATKRATQQSEELSPELSAQHFPGEEKLRIPAPNPACLIEGNTAGWNQAMDMRVSQQLLIPAMQDSQKAEACPQMPWIGSNRQQRLRNGTEEYAVDNRGILQRKRNEFVRQSKDHV